MESNELFELRTKKNKLNMIYLECKPKCFGFMRKCFGTNHMDETKMFTIFNDAVIVLQEKAYDPNFELTCTIQTFLNSVCRNIALNEFKKEKKLFKTTDQDLENMDYDNHITDVLEEIKAESPYEVALQKAFNIMKGQEGNCAKILTMFWYQNVSLPEIAEIFSYKDYVGAKSGKAKCQKKLKDIALQLVKL